jgi:cytochrome P450
VDNLPKCLKAMGVHFPIFGEESLALAASDEKGDEHWRTVRKSIAPGFKKGHLERSWTADIVEEGDDFVRRLSLRAVDGKSAPMAEYLVETTLDLILRVTIGTKDRQLSRNILRVLNQQLDHASSMGINSILGKYNPVARYGEWKRTRSVSGHAGMSTLLM